MASIRLNKAIRATIASNISEAYTKNNPAPEFKNAGDFKEIFVNAAKEHYIKQSNLILFAAKNAGLESYMRKISRVLIHWNGEYKFPIEFETPVIQLQENTTCFEIMDKGNKPVLKAWNEYQEAIKSLKPAQDALKAWKLQHDNYMEEVKNVLDGVNTTGQLLEAWPECSDFIPAGIKNPSKIQLPVVSIAALTAAIKPTTQSTKP